MTKTKAIRILNKTIENCGDAVLWYLVDYYKKKLARVKIETEEKRWNFAQDVLDYKCGEVKISDIIKYVEDGELDKYMDVVRKIQKAGCVVARPCKDYIYTTIEQSKMSYLDYCDKNKEKIKTIRNDMFRCLNSIPYLNT